MATIAQVAPLARRLAPIMGWASAQVAAAPAQAPVTGKRKPAATYQVLYKLDASETWRTWCPPMPLAHVEMLLCGAIKAGEYQAERSLGTSDTRPADQMGAADLVSLIAARPSFTRNPARVAHEVANALMNAADGSRSRFDVAEALADEAYPNAPKDVQRELAENAGLDVVREDQKVVSLDDVARFERLGDVLAMVDERRPTEWWLPDLRRVADGARLAG